MERQGGRGRASKGVGGRKEDRRRGRDTHETQSRERTEWEADGQGRPGAQGDKNKERHREKRRRAQRRQKQRQSDRGQVGTGRREGGRARRDREARHRWGRKRALRPRTRRPRQLPRPPHRPSFHTHSPHSLPSEPWPLATAALWPATSVPRPGREAQPLPGHRGPESHHSPALSLALPSAPAGCV